MKFIQYSNFIIKSNRYHFWYHVMYGGFLAPFYFFCFLSLFTADSSDSVGSMML